MNKDIMNKKMKIVESTINPAVEAFDTAPTMKEGLIAAFNIIELVEVKEGDSTENNN